MGVVYAKIVPGKQREGVWCDAAYLAMQAKERNRGVSLLKVTAFQSMSRQTSDAKRQDYVTNLLSHIVLLDRDAVV